MKPQVRSSRETFVAATRKIKYYQPFQRLYLRQIISEVLKNQNASRFDLFAIFDAIAKRGGLQKVDTNNRWQEISLSLPYYKYDFRSKYKEFIQAKQAQVIACLKQFKKQYMQQAEPFVEFHLLSITNPYGYYHVEDESFSKHNFSNIDIYLNMRTICSYKPKVEKIIVEYAQKFYIMRKNMLMYGQTRPYNDKQFKILKLVQNNDKTKVAIVGWSISSIITALRLKQFNIESVIYPNLDPSELKQSNLITQQGVFMLDDSQFPYEKRLRQYGVLLQQISQSCCLVDQFGKQISSKKIRQSQELFCSLLSQLKHQQSSKRNLYAQMLYVAQKKRLSIDTKLIKWHFQRYFMLNQLRGDYTTVSDIHNYLTKRKFRVFLKKRKIYFIKDCSKLLQKAKSQLTINCQPLKTINYKNYEWVVNNQAKIFSHFIYSESQSVTKAILNSNYKINYMEDSFPILYNLNFVKYVSCLYKFTEKVKTKAQIQQKCIQTEYNNGYLFFFIVKEGFQVIAISKITSLGVTKNIFYTQILAILQNRILQNCPQLAQKQTEICSFSYSFPVKEQAVKDRITRLKSKQKMYLSLSYGTNIAISRLSSQIDTSNYIIGIILNSTNNLQVYEKSQLDKFDHTYSNRVAELNVTNSSVAIIKKKSSQIPNQSIKISKKQKMEIQPPLQKMQVQAPIIQIENNYKLIPKLEQFYQRLASSSQILKQNTKYSQHQTDPFGFSSPVVINYIKYLKKNCEFQKSLRDKKQKNIQILKYLQWNNLQQAVSLSRGLMLHSFGQVSFKQPKMKQILKQTEQINNLQIPLCIFDGYVTRRQYYCLRKGYKTTVYIQCIVYLQNTPYFIIFDEYMPSTIYYHTNVNFLIDQFNKNIQPQKYQCLSNQSKLNRVKMKPLTSNNIYLSEIKIAIQEQLKLNQSKTLDQILKSKFRGDFSNTRIKNAQTNDQHYQLILKKLQDFLSIQIKNYCLRPISLVDVFFGYLNQQYLILQIMNQNQLTLQKIEQLDPQLSQQIQKIYTNDKKNEDFQLIIHHQTHRLIVYREFLTSKNDSQSDSITKKYILIKEFQNNKFNMPIIQNFHYYLMKSVNSQKIQIKYPDQPLKQIIMPLLATWTSLQIYQQFQRLIRKQLLNEFTLSPKLKIYFQMTRRQYNFVDQKDLNPIIQKNKKLEEDERTNLSEGIQNEDILFVNGQYVFLGY